MRWLLFLSRLSFICGICFLIAFSIHFKDWVHDETTVSTILIICFVIGIIVVPLTLLSYIGVLIARKTLPVPIWLVISNIIFLIILLLYIILINGQHNPQT